MAKKLKLGIVGTGVAARELYRPAWPRLRHKIELVACTNRTRAKAEAYAKACGIPKVTGSVTALINLPEVEAVLISLPIHVQPKIVLQALAAGKAVLSEKPIAPSVAAGRRLLAKTARHEVPWMVAENFRFMSHVTRLKRSIEKGKLGQIRLFQATQIVMMDERNPYYHTSWRQRPQHVGGFVVDAGVHLADVLIHCFGPLARASGLTAAFSDLPAPDTAVGVLRFESGVLGTLSCCFSAAHNGAAHNAPMLQVFGSKGSASLFWDRAELYDQRGRATVYRNRVDSFEAQFSHFADVVKKGIPAAMTPAAALADLELMQRIVGKG